MPSPGLIVAGLAEIANDCFALAVVVHILIGLLGVGFAFGLRLTRRTSSLLVGSLLGTVAAVALAFRNPFNATTFGLLCAAHGVAAFAPRAERTHATGPLFERAIGWSLLLFGWTYPHFLVDASPFAYLIGAPLGLIPCPTLAFAAGLVLVGRTPGPAILSLLLALAALFYGLFGVLRLGVLLDCVLLLGAAALLHKVHGLGWRMRGGHIKRDSQRPAP